MRVKYRFITKQEVVACREVDTLEQAFRKMEDSGYRCIPVLTEDAFMGLLYKIDVLEALYKGAEKSQLVTELVEDQKAFVYERDSFFRAFYTIRRLPFLAVLNDQKEFTGILTHGNVFDVLEDSFGMNTGGYTLTLATHDKKGTIKELGHLLRHHNIGGLLTLDNGDKYVRRIIVNLTDIASNQQLEQVITSLERNDFRVSRVDCI